jgi:AcrR family transcriptional regulator
MTDRHAMDRARLHDFRVPSYASNGMKNGARKEERKAPQLRGERVVEKILEATLEEMALSGFSGLSMEAVAERANVAKTTVYRRWPTRGDLVVSAMRQVADDIVRVEDTGSVRGDLERLLSSFRDFVSTPRGQSLMRMMLTEVSNSEIVDFVRRFREEKSHEPHELIVRAIARGELPRDTDASILLDVAFGAVQHYACFMQARVSDAQIAQIIDLVLLGAEHGGAIPARRRASKSRGRASVGTARAKSARPRPR